MLLLCTAATGVAVLQLSVVAIAAVGVASVVAVVVSVAIWS